MSQGGLFHLFLVLPCLFFICYGEQTTTFAWPWHWTGVGSHINFKWYISWCDDLAWHRFIALLFTEVLCWKRYVRSGWLAEFVFRFFFGCEVNFEYKHMNWFCEFDIQGKLGWIAGKLLAFFWMRRFMESVLTQQFTVLDDLVQTFAFSLHNWRIYNIEVDTCFSGDNCIYTLSILHYWKFSMPYNRVTRRITWISALPFTCSFGDSLQICEKYPTRWRGEITV